MKSFKDFVKEEVPTTSTSSGAVAGLGEGPQGEPPKKTKLRLLRRRDPLAPIS